MIVQNDWNSIAPWVSVALAGLEPAIHYANLEAKNYMVGDAAWTADFDDARSFLYLLQTGAGQNDPGYSNARYDELLRRADNEPDLQARAALLREAEQLALDDAPLCMSVFTNSLNLVHPDLSGFEDNLADIHRARWFGIKP